MKAHVLKIPEFRFLGYLTLSVIVLTFLSTNIFFYWASKERQEKQIILYQKSIHDNFAKINEFMEVMAIRIKNTLDRKTPNYIRSMLNEDFKLKIGSGKEVTIQQFFLIQNIFYQKRIGPYGESAHSQLPYTFLEKIIKQQQHLHLLKEDEGSRITLCKGFFFGETPYFLCFSLKEEALAKLLGVPLLPGMSISQAVTEKDQKIVLEIPTTHYKISFERPSIAFLSSEGFFYTGIAVFVSLLFFIYFFFIHHRLSKGILKTYQERLQSLEESLSFSKEENRSILKDKHEIKHTFDVCQESYQAKVQFLEELVLENRKIAQEIENLMHAFLKSLFLEHKNLLESNEINQTTQAISGGLAVLSHKVMPLMPSESVHLNDLVHQAHVFFSKELLEKKIKWDVKKLTNEADLVRGPRLFWEYIIYALFKGSLQRVSAQGNIKVAVQKPNQNLEVIFWDDGYSFDFQKNTSQKKGFFDVPINALQKLLKSASCHVNQTFTSKEGNKITLVIKSYELAQRERFENFKNIIPFIRHESE